MKKSFLIVGLGRFGLSIVKTLKDLKADVIAIDIDENQVNKAATMINHCVICDATNKNHLKEIGASHIDHAVITIGGNLQATIIATINLKEMGVKEITVRVDDDEYVSIMERLGATDVIIPEEASAVGLANQIISDSILDYYKISAEFGIVQIQIREGFKPISLISLDSRNSFDVNIVGIMRDNHFFIPKGVDMIQAKDVIFVIGKTFKITKFDSYLND